MDFKLIHRIGGFAVFVLSTVVLLMTAAPTLSFWDCGEFITAAVTMSVPHPPGAPFFQLLGRVFSLLPTGADIGFRVNLLSVFSSSLTVLFTYLTAMRLLRMWHGERGTPGATLAMVFSAAAGALVLSFSDTFWFNGVETEMYGIGMLFISVSVWIALEWYAHAGVFDTERTLLLVAYLMGLSIGIHLLSLLAVFFVFILIYLRDRERGDFTLKSMLVAAGLSTAGFIVLYPGIVKWLPSLLAMSYGGIVFAVIASVLVTIVVQRRRHPQLRMAGLAVLLAVIGYSTYTLVLVRANDKPPLNENDPYNFERLYGYLNRDQYGSYPLMRGENFDQVTQRIDASAQHLFPRRWSPASVDEYRKYSSDTDYFLSFQLGHMYLRYLMWNFVGRAGDRKDAPAVFLGDAGDWSESAGYPNRYYAIPFILALIGLGYHFKKDKRTGTAFMALFLVFGLGLVVYFNMVEPQVRERDYFFVGSFYVFALWAGLGVYALAGAVGRLLRARSAVMPAALVLAALAPGIMLTTNYRTHSRSLNYVAFDYAYNTLQSCEKDAILVTGGDNDTFPLWYCQYVAGIRRDVRIVNLALLNAEWYAKQLKNERPYGALPVAIAMTDDELDALQPQAWKKTTISLPVTIRGADFRSVMDTPDIIAAMKSVEGRDTIGMELTIEPTFRDSQGNAGLRNQDMMLLEIVRSNLGSRPVHITLNGDPKDYIGLQPYMVVEGMTYRVLPARPAQNGRYYGAVSVTETRKHLMRTRETPDSNRAYGFMFRELANPRINLDEASTPIVTSYRFLYLALADALNRVAHDENGAREVMRKMEALFPAAIHPVNESVDAEIGAMSLSLLDTAGVKARYAVLERFLMDNAASGGKASGNNYAMLLSLYQVAGESKKEVELLEKLRKLYPGDTALARLTVEANRRAGANR